MPNVTLIQMIIAISNSMGFDPQIALAVAHTESKFNMQAVGALGEVGAFQVRPEYSKYSVEELFVAEINIREGIHKLQEAQKFCKHKDGLDFVVCFNVGNAGGNKIRYPRLFPYYVKVSEAYRRMNLQPRIDSVLTLDAYNMVVYANN